MKTILKLYGLQEMPVNDFSLHPLTWQPDPGGLRRPKYLSLAARLEKDVEDGVLPPGTRLPPQRLLADYLDINFTTVTRAYDICRERSLVYGVTGRGTFVAPLPGGGDGRTDKTADLGAVQCFPMLGSDLIIDAAREVLGRDYTSRLFSYGERDGAARHRSAGAYWLGRFAVPAAADQTAVFPGVQNALSTILLAFFRAGDALAVDDFTYSNLIGATNLMHLRLVPVAGDEHGMLPDALETAVKKNSVRGVFLMPTCANPTTITIPSKRRDALADIIIRNDMLVIEDDAALAAGSADTFFARLPERTFFLTGNTRFISSGLRVAFAAYPQRFKDKLLSALHKLTIKTSALDAEIMSELILSGRADDILSQKIKRAKEMNAVFKTVFPRLGRKAKDVPFFRTIPLGNPHESGQEIERELFARNVRVCHSYRFAAKKNPPKSFLRVSLSSVNSKTELAKALRIVKAYLGD